MANILSRIKQHIFNTPENTQKTVEGYFLDIKDFNYDVFLDFMYGGVTYQAKAKCTAIDSTTARLVLRTEDALPKRDTNVAFFFMIKKGKRKTPCYFDAKVLDSKRTEELSYIDIGLPQEIKHGQRRQNLRVQIDSSKIPNFRVWAGKEIVSTDQGNNKKNKITWEPLGQEEFELVDISAGGIMIKVAKTAECTPRLRKDFKFLCTGSFNEPPTELALVGKIMRLDIPEKGPWNIIGLKFWRWTKVTEGKVTWITVDESGVSLLGGWLAAVMAQLAKYSK